MSRRQHTEPEHGRREPLPKPEGHPIEPNPPGAFVIGSAPPPIGVIQAGKSSGVNQTAKLGSGAPAEVLSVARALDNAAAFIPENAAYEPGPVYLSGLATAARLDAEAAAFRAKRKAARRAAYRLEVVPLVWVWDFVVVRGPFETIRSFGPFRIVTPGVHL